MSQQMIEAKSIVEKIIEKIGKDQPNNTLLDKLKNIDKMISQNQKKIWLRTKSGKPMAEKLQLVAADVLKRIENGIEIESAIDTFENITNEIDQESQRRSMIVT